MGLFLLDKLSSTFEVGYYGIYRDDGLAVVEKASPGQQERLTKEIKRVFGEQGFKITIEKELKRTEFLDAILDLNSDSHRPYKKPNTKLSYVSRLSNHPKTIKNEIPNTINRRLSQLSSNQHEFDSVKSEYEEALKKCNYNEKMVYTKNNENQEVKKRKRRRKIIFFQPPFCDTVKTPIGRLVLRLVQKHFTKSHPLHKILNPKCIKISYSCLPNAKSRIMNVNRRTLKSDENKNTILCNCRRKSDCPVENKCQLDKVIYKAEVKDKNGNVKEYIGSTGNTFKERYNQHKATFREKKTKKNINKDQQTTRSKYVNKNNKGVKYTKTNKTNGTALSRHYLEVKERDGIEPTIKWTIIGKTNAMPNDRNGCTLCNLEKIAIAKAKRERSLNVRRELVNACPHFLRQFFKKPL